MIQSMSLETSIPPAGRHKYTDALHQVLQLEPGECLKLDFEHIKAALSARISLHQSIKRHGYPAKVMLRGRSVYIRREEQV